MKRILFTLLIVSFISHSESLFQVRDASENVVFDISSDGMRVYNLGDTLMVISATAIKAFIDNSKALSRTFSVTTTSSKGKGQENVLEVNPTSTVMREGSFGQEYTDFSPDNIFVGLHAGQFTSGTSNVFIGNDAGFSNTTGLANVFIGNEAGYSSQDKISNTYVGHAAGKESTGGMNAFYGYASGYQNQGDNNSFFGQNSGSTNTTGSNNCLFGYYSGVASDGSYNTMIGTESGKTNETGSGNVFLGYRSGMNESGSNRLYIDNSDTAAPLIYGEFDTNTLVFNTDATRIKHPIGNTTKGLFIQSTYNGNTDSWHFYQATNDDLNLFYNTTLRGTFNQTTGIYTSSSDKKFKKNVEDLPKVMDRVMLLQPKRYNFITQNDDENKFIGLIAQDVKELFPEFVNHDEESDSYTMDYAGLSVVAIQAIKEQQNEIDKLRKENESIKERLAEIEAVLLKIR